MNKGLSADKVKGSGPNGRITKSDVAAYVAGGVDADAIALNGWGGTRNQNAPEDDHPAQEGGRAPW
jgi:pyruvate/2-oxoglutarate dehydrogenase complex dihydrolipoamide acyltransferase (E2) component